MELDMKPHWIASLCLALLASIAQAQSSPPYELKASLGFARAAPDQYLLVYSSNEVGSGAVIYGRVLSPDGSPLGKDFRLSTQVGLMTKPVLAYNPLTEQFLVVWGRKQFGEDRAEIIGRNVALDGRIVGEEFRISYSDLYDQRPAIAYCPGRDRFLVTWTGGPEYDFEKGESDVYGQFIGGDGTRLQGSNFTIASGAKNQFKSDVSCDVVNDRFLVVWEDQRQLATQDDVYGQLISSDGAMLGGNFLVAGTGNIERRPVVAANTKNGTYLVAWESIVEGNVRVFSQIIDSNGRLLREPTPIGSELGGQRNRPAVAYLREQDVFFVAVDNTAYDALDDGIYGQFVKSNGQLRDTIIPVTTAKMSQYRPAVEAARNTFLVVWTDYRDAAGADRKRNVYEYYGRVIGNDMALSSRWRNPDSK
jgi:large repetitive protein